MCPTVSKAGGNPIPGAVVHEFDGAAVPQGHLPARKGPPRTSGGVLGAYKIVGR
jgi:hypothetical protein